MGKRIHNTAVLLLCFLMASCSSPANFQPPARSASAPALTAAVGGNATPSAPAGGETLFSDDFESGTGRWLMDSGWKTVEEAGSTALKGSGHQWLRCSGGMWEDYGLSVRLNLVQGAIHINIRYDAETGNRYFVGLESDSISLHKQTGNQFTELVSDMRQITPGWHELQVKACGSLINILLDGQLCIVYEDKAPLKSGGVAFETLDESECMIDDVNVARAEYAELASQPPVTQSMAIEWSKPDEVHKGDLILNGSESLTIENATYLQQGNIYINDRAKLTIRNATFILARGSVPTIHTYFFIAPGASLIIDTSKMATDTSEQMNALMIIRNEGNLEIRNSQTRIHLIEMYTGSHFTMTDSTVVNPIGGLLQVMGGDTKIVNSTIGALGLAVPKGARADISALRSGSYFEAWDVRDMIPKADYTLTMEKTTVLKDELDYGPYERGWLFFPAAGSSLSLKDSELRKVFVDIRGDNASFANLKMGVPSSLDYKDVHLTDVVMRGEWPFTIIDSTVSFRNSEYLFLQPSGKSTVNLSDSNLVEFIPRGFTGTIHFENSTWSNAGELIGGEAYHSQSNDFTITGSLYIAPELREHLQWKDATVTREYEAILSDPAGNPLSGLALKLDGKEYRTDKTGKAVFKLRFNEANYAKALKLEVFNTEKPLASADVDFFTETPIRITAGSKLPPLPRSSSPPPCRLA